MCDWLKTVNKKVHIALHRDKLATVLPMHTLKKGLSGCQIGGSSTHLKYWQSMQSTKKISHLLCLCLTSRKQSGKRKPGDTRRENEHTQLFPNRLKFI